WQWYWDSCFTAIAWRRFDRSRARAELESLLAASTPDGFIGHTIFWGEPVSPVRSLFYNVRSRDDFMTATIQPPLLSWAWRIAVAGGPVVCGTATNVLNGLSRLALGLTSITPRIVERLYDERSGLFHQIVARGSERAPTRHPVVTWAALSPLALPDLPEEIGRRLVEEHLLNPHRFWLPVPPPSVSADEPR